MRKLGLAGVVAMAASTLSVAAPAIAVAPPMTIARLVAASPSVAHCSLEVSLAFSEAIGPLGAPVQEVAITTVTPGTISCEGDFAGELFAGSGSLTVTGTFTGTCLAHRATGSYEFSHPLENGTTIIRSGEFANHRGVDRTAFDVRGADHAGAGTAKAAVNGDPCRQPFDRALFTADVVLESH